MVVAAAVVAADSSDSSLRRWRVVVVQPFRIVDSFAASSASADASELVADPLECVVADVASFAVAVVGNLPAQIRRPFDDTDSERTLGIAVAGESVPAAAAAVVEELVVVAADVPEVVEVVVARVEVPAMVVAPILHVD